MMELWSKIENKMNQQVKRMTVGPVPAHPEILKIIGKQYFSTRDSVFIEAQVAIQSGLQESVGTRTNFVILEHGSGSSGLCAVGNHLLAPWMKVLVVNTGKFGERLTKIAQKRQCIVTEINVVWGKAIDWSIIGQKLAEIKPEVLMMQHSETSTGSVHSLSDAAAALQKYSLETLLMVDAISSWGSLPIEMDKNHIDAVVGCSQKGFMLPTGLHMMAFSERALAQIKKNTDAKLVTDFSHNPIKDIEEQKAGKPRFSMDSNSIMALYYLFNKLIPEMGGWQGLWAGVHNRAEKLRKALAEMGLKLLPDSDCAGDTVIAIHTPEGKTAKQIRKDLEANGFEINGSQDEAKFDGFRIGNMGYITNEDIDQLILALPKATKHLAEAKVS